MEKSEVVAALEDDCELALGAVGCAAPRQVRAECVRQVEQEGEHWNEGYGCARAVRRRTAAQLAHRRVPLHRQRQQHQNPDACNSITIWLTQVFPRTDGEKTIFVIKLNVQISQLALNIEFTSSIINHPTYSHFPLIHLGFFHNILIYIILKWSLLFYKK